METPLLEAVRSAGVDDRVLWAALAALVGGMRDGELCTPKRLFDRLEAACRAFGVPADEFDACAHLLDYHYYRPWDCYLGRADIAEMTGPAH
jgi:hypothetical protein